GKHIPPFLILHVADHPDTTGQSQRLFRALREAEVPARIHPAEGKNHTTINDDLGTPSDKPTKALFEFLGAVSKGVEGTERNPCTPGVESVCYRAQGISHLRGKSVSVCSVENSACS